MVKAVSRSAPIAGAQNALLGPRGVFIGTSITAGSTFPTDTATAGAVNQSYGMSYANVAGVVCGDRFRLVHNAGVAGNNSSQMVARWQTSVANYNPDIVFIQVDGNDEILTLAQTKANIETMVNNTLALGATPIILIAPPRNYLASGQNNPSLLDIVAFQRAYCAANKILNVDFFHLLTDPITGNYKTQYNLAVSATGGTYTVTIGPYTQGGVNVPTTLGLAAAVTTGNIAYNATSAQVQAAINAAGSGGDIKAIATGPTGGPYNIYNPEGYPWVITTNATSLTGGAGTATLTQGPQYSVDGTHPSIQGQILMARAIQKLMEQEFPKISITADFSDNRLDHQSEYLINVTDNTNLLNNGCFTYFSPPGDTSGSLDAWVNAGGQGALSFVQDSETNGNWMQSTITGGAAYQLYEGPQITPGASTYSDGHTIAFSGKIEAAGYEAVSLLNYNNSTPPSWSIELNVLATSGNVNIQPVSGFTVDLTGTFYGEITLPAGTTALYVSSFAGSSAQQIRFSELRLVNLSTFGAST